jgi:mRNA-degrading endonuclease YafQ of YafQ-DinJ toxin-antitoxin module
MKISEIFEAKKPRERKPLIVRKYDTFNNSFKEKTRGRPALVQQLLDKIQYITNVKSENPLTRVGGNDGPMHGKLSGYFHCHLTRDPDLSLIYNIKNGAINLYAIAQHNDYQNEQRRISLAQQFNNAEEA